MKKFLSVLTVLVLSLMLFACDKDNEGGGEKLRTVKLSVWASDLDQDFTQELIDEFIDKHKEEVKLEIKLSAVSEADAKDEVLADLEEAADVFAFADDQLNDLLKAGALQEILEDTDNIIKNNGGLDSGAIQAAYRDNKLYAYPMTADNGYFLFYDKSVYSSEDVLKLDTILEISKEKGKKFGMTVNDGWYMYSFFAGAGLTLNFDGDKNIADWNKDPEGVNVAKALIALADHEGFLNAKDAEIITGIKNGTISAAVNGVWNADEAKKAWGDNYAATKLPTYTLDGKQTQMASFAGYKLIGVNRTSLETGWAMKLANFLTNEESQIRRFEARGLGPSNVNAAKNPKVLEDPAISALAQQGQFANIQNVGDNYWAPAESFGEIIVSKELTKNSTTKEILDKLNTMVEGINS